MGDDEQAKRSRPLRRALLLALCALVGAELFYLAGANAFLRGESGRRVLSRRPQALTVGWRSAWTWLPGVVHVRGLEIGGRARRAEWRTTIDSGRLLVWLPSLARRHVRLRGGSALGAEIRIRTLPPPAAPRPGEPAGPRPGKRRRPWRVSLEDVEVDPLRLFRLDDYELRGRGRAVGSAGFAVRGPVALELTSLAFDQAVLVDGGQVAADALRLDGRLRIEPFVVGEDGVADLLAGLTGAMSLEAESAGLGFLRAYLEGVPWLRLGGRGHLTAELEAAGGSLAPGSRLTLEGPTVEADLFGLQAIGQGRLEGVVPAGSTHTELTARLHEFAVTRRQDGARLLEGEDLKVVVTNDSNAIDRPARGISLTVTVPPAGVPDLAAFSRYLPEAAELRLTGGTARLEAGFAYSATRRTGDGRLHLSGRQVEARFRDLDLRAEVRLDARLGDLRLEEGNIDLSGSRLEIAEAETRRGGRLRDRGWWGRIDLPEGALTRRSGGAPPRIEARLAAELRDTGPLVALLEQRLPKLAWMDRLLTVREVSAGARLELEGPRLALAGLEVSGGEKERLEILGELDLAREDSSGLLFARWGRLSAAVSLAAGERDWKLIRSRRWYDEGAAAYRASRRAAGGGR